MFLHQQQKYSALNPLTKMLYTNLFHYLQQALEKIVMAFVLKMLSSNHSSAILSPIARFFDYLNNFFPHSFDKLLGVGKKTWLES